jgi:FKBP-type peptidyl-prolyl cis-trans isomerase 2
MARKSRGTTINIDYTGYLEDGQLFDTSLESEAKIFGKLDPQGGTKWLSANCVSSRTKGWYDSWIH